MRDFFKCFTFHAFVFLQRARRNSCIDPTTGRRLNFLEVFPEDLLCHASALSSFAAATTYGGPFSAALSLYIVITAAVAGTIPNLFSYFYTNIQL